MTTTTPTESRKTKSPIYGEPPNTSDSHAPPQIRGQRRARTTFSNRITPLGRPLPRRALNSTPRHERPQEREGAPQATGRRRSRP